MILALNLFMCQCQGTPSNQGEETEISSLPERQSVRFVDVANEVGIGAFFQENGNREKPYIVESIGGGVAFLDYDNDGDLDVYFTNGSSFEGFPPGQQPRDRLYNNDGQGHFTDVTTQAGLGDSSWTNGVAIADYDNDGWPDIYLTNFGPNVLYHNNANGTFTDVTRVAGVGDPKWSTGACFFDSDNDGDLDLYVANYVDFDKNFKPDRPEFCTWRGVMVQYGPKGLKGATDTFYRNNGHGTFTEVTGSAQINDPGYYGFQAVAFDYDEDGDLDVYVANDSTPNFLWRNNGDGTFTDVGLQTGLALSGQGKEQAGMGVTLGDYNQDGRLDLYVTNFSEDYNTLYRNDGGGLFTDVTQEVNLAQPVWLYLGWGCHFFDFDNDGDADLFAANGHVYPQVDRFDFGVRYRQKNQLFENVNLNRYSEITLSAGPGLLIEKCSRGAAFGDYDNDGDIDILINNLDDHPTLLRNESRNGHHWITIRLIGTKSDRNAMGAKVIMTAGGRTQTQSVVSGTSFLSANDHRLHFGLGSFSRVDQIEIRWPSNSVEQVKNLPADRFITIEEGRGILEPTAQP